MLLFPHSLHMQLHLFIYLKQAAVEPLSHYYDHNVSMSTFMYRMMNESLNTTWYFGWFLTDISK